MCKFLNIGRTDLSALWFAHNQPILAINLNRQMSIDGGWRDKIQNGIIDSLKRDIPVTLSYGIGGKFDFRYWEDPSTVYDDRVVGGHYINVTEFVIDKIAQDKYMRIAT